MGFERLLRTVTFMFMIENIVVLMLESEVGNMVLVKRKYQFRPTGDQKMHEWD